MKRPYLQVMTMMLLAVFLWGCEKQRVETLQIGTSLWPGYEPLFLAKKEGYYNNPVIHFVEYPIPSGAVRAMVNGSIQAAALTMDEVLKIAELGIPIKVVLVMDISEGGDVLMARPKVKSVADLKGDTIVTEGSVLSQYLLGRALEINGMTKKDINMISMDATKHAKVFNDKNVDAVITYEPAKTLLLRKGAKILFSSSDISGEIVDVLIVHDDYLRKYPDVVRDLIDGWFQALEKMKKDPNGAAKVISARLRISENEVLESYKGLILPDRNHVKAMLQGRDDVLKKGSSKLVKTMHEQGLLKNEIDVASLFSADYLR